MKKFIIGTHMFSMLTLVGCAQQKRINGAVVKPYGIFNTEQKYENVKYEVSKGNVFWSVLGFPYLTIWLCGWELWEPIGIDDGKPNLVKP